MTAKELRKQIHFRIKGTKYKVGDCFETNKEVIAELGKNHPDMKLGQYWIITKVDKNEIYKYFVGSVEGKRIDGWYWFCDDDMDLFTKLE